MKLKSGEIYHVYNRGNNRQRVFYESRNYHYFLLKVKKYVAPYCDILAYCLMPNHFHMLIHANHKTVSPYQHYEDPIVLKENNPYVFMTAFSHGMQLLLSSYSKAINKAHKRSGSLFTQNTKSKRTSSEAFSMDYTLWCFIYIHNNPCMSGLVSSPEQWPYSSYNEYLGKIQDPLCNIDLGQKLLSLETNELISFNGFETPGHIIDKIF
ncbi:MAG: transposase [Saprospiraceae bacterium]|nr:transposase [Candidatus Opimibacter skivensis]MBP6680962.1 transposase [Saprospiraceae bacterium]